MPPCKNCLHAGEEHNWQRRTRWGRCTYPNCDCRKYVPKTGKPKPANRTLGRYFYKKSNH